MKNIRVTEDAANPNNLRVHSEDLGQICKVYGWNPITARLKADMIVEGLSLVGSPEIGWAWRFPGRGWVFEKNRDDCIVEGRVGGEWVKTEIVKLAGIPDDS